MGLSRHTRADTDSTSASAARWSFDARRRDSARGPDDVEPLELLFEVDGLPMVDLPEPLGRLYGGALGLQYLFALDQQLVFEVATTRPRKDLASSTLVGRELALGMRYQKTLDKAWIFRMDAMVADRANAKGLAGLRFEVRRKF